MRHESSAHPGLAASSDDQLRAELLRLAGREREATAELIAHLAEFDERRLYLGAGFSSLFAYCLAVLRLSEDEAYNRIEAARAASRCPALFERLREGSLNLTTIRLLAPHLSAENRDQLLAAASGKTRREVEEIVASHFPRAPVPSSVRALPAPKAAEPLRDDAHAAITTEGEGVIATDGAASQAPIALPTSMSSPASPPNAAPANVAPATPGLHASAVPHAPAVPRQRAVVAPLAPDRYRITFTGSAETHRMLRRAQDLLRHQIPDGNLTEVFDRALSALVAQLEKRKVAVTDRPRDASTASTATSALSRRIPAAVRRAVWQRDGGRCAFVAKDGRRCDARGFLEFHHARPYAAGGETSIGNIALRCRPHNGYEARLYFGPLQAVGDERLATRSGTSSPDAGAPH